MIVAALVGGLISGAGGPALAASQDGGSHGNRLEHLQRIVRGALDSVGATTVQEDKIHDILAANFSTTGERSERRRAMRKQMLELLRAPTIDRAAAEKLRSEQVAAFDAHTKKVLGALLDAADQLSPDQRAKLEDRLQAMAWHRGGMEGRRWHGAGSTDGPEHEPYRGPGDDGPDHDGGPDKG